MLFEIKWLLKTTDYSKGSIANAYGLTKGTIAYINSGKSHKSEGETYPLRPYYSTVVEVSPQELMNTLYLELEGLNDN